MLRCVVSPGSCWKPLESVSLCLTLDSSSAPSPFPEPLGRSVSAVPSGSTLGLGALLAWCSSQSLALTLFLPICAA